MERVRDNGSNWLWIGAALLALAGWGIYTQLHRRTRWCYNPSPNNKWGMMCLEVDEFCRHGIEKRLEFYENAIAL